MPAPEPQPDELRNFPQGQPNRPRCRWCNKTKSHVPNRPGLVCLVCDYAPTATRETT